MGTAECTLAGGGDCSLATAEIPESTEGDINVEIKL